MARTLREDVFHGTVYGLGLSATLWTLVLSVPGEPAVLVGWALAAGAGTLRARLPRLGRLDLAYVVLLAIGLAHGAGAGLIAGLLCQGSTILTQRTGRRRIRNPGFVLASTALAAGLAAAATGWAGYGSGLPAVLLLCLHAGVYTAARRALDIAALRATGRFRGLGPSPLGAVRGAPGYVLGIGAAHAAAGILALPGGPGALAAGVILVQAGAILGARRRVARSRALREVETAGWQSALIRALTRTQEAADGRTHAHVRRVRRLCISVGRRLGLSSIEMEALTSGALLHDLGKIAVPQGILSKPGRLTDEERRRVRIHPDVGAEILRGIPFPYPLAPTIRHHHERWDGRGYPSGLRGEAIPLTSRILAAVDAFDALTTDRPYRQALSRDEAIAFLQREKGLTFDPTIVEALIECLDAAEVVPVVEPTRSEEAPRADAGREEGADSRGGLPLSRRELETLYDIAGARDHGLNLDEYLTLVSCRLGPLVPHAAFVAYAIDEQAQLLRACFAAGKAADKLRLTTVPLGQRVSGWVAAKGRVGTACGQRSPMDRDGWRSDLEDWGADAEMQDLSAALAAPLISDGRVVGVVTLYDRSDRGFNADDTRILARVAGYVAPPVCRSGRSTSLAATSLTDPLTGVPNARFLWLESAHRMTLPDAEGFGLLAFRILDMEQIVGDEGNEAADRLICEVARRFAACSHDGETRVRFGQDLFIVLTADREPDRLVDRWHALATEVERPTWSGPNGCERRVRLAASHASYPDDGVTLDALLDTLDARLGSVAAGRRVVVPFRPREAVAPAV